VVFVWVGWCGDHYRPTPGISMRTR
jgi:hypothetical protein